MAACVPHIVQGKIGGVACRRSLCQEFNDNERGKGERRGHSKLMLPGMACGTRCNAYPCVAKLARAEFPACQAALDEFNGLAVVQAWRSQPAPQEQPVPPGTTPGPRRPGRPRRLPPTARCRRSDEVRGTATVAPPTPAIATKLVDACACTSVHMCRARVYGVCGGSR